MYSGNQLQKARKGKKKKIKTSLTHTIGTHSRYDIKPPSGQNIRITDLGDPEARETGVTLEEHLASSRILDVSHDVFVVFYLFVYLIPHFIFFSTHVINSCLHCKSPEGNPKLPMFSLSLAFFFILFFSPQNLTY